MQNTRLHTCLAHGTGDPQLTDFDYEAEKILMGDAHTSLRTHVIKRHLSKNGESALNSPSRKGHRP
jgi:hypothetical protein